MLIDDLLGSNFLFGISGFHEGPSTMDLLLGSGVDVGGAVEQDVCSTTIPYAGATAGTLPDFNTPIVLPPDLLPSPDLVRVAGLAGRFSSDGSAVSGLGFTAELSVPGP